MASGRLARMSWARTDATQFISKTAIQVINTNSLLLRVMAASPRLGYRVDHRWNQAGGHEFPFISATPSLCCIDNRQKLWPTQAPTMRIQFLALLCYLAASFAGPQRAAF